MLALARAFAAGLAGKVQRLHPLMRALLSSSMTITSSLYRMRSEKMQASSETEAVVWVGAGPALLGTGLVAG